MTPGSEVDLGAIAVVAQLPNYFHPYCGAAIPDDLIGATIISFGSLAESVGVLGGGLVIDYQRPGDGDRVRRLVLACQDTGMWECYRGMRSGASKLVQPLRSRVVCAQVGLGVSLPTLKTCAKIAENRRKVGKGGCRDDAR